MNSKTLKADVEGILEKLKSQFGKKEKDEWNGFIEDIQKYKWNPDETSEKVFDRLKEIKIKFDNLNSEEDDNPEENNTSNKTFHKILLKMVLKAGEESQKLDSAESIKLEEKFDELNYDWDKAKEAFQKF